MNNNNQFCLGELRPYLDELTKSIFKYGHFPISLAPDLSRGGSGSLVSYKE